MPQIKVRGIHPETIRRLSTQLIDELQVIIGCPRDYFTLECIHSTYIFDGEIVQGYPFIEVVWFDRGQEIQDQVAQTIHRVINTTNYPNVDIFFTALEESKYYENGEHF